jgi:hypothetical protein
MKIMHVLCPEAKWGCTWHHDEVVAESVIPPGLMGAFSDPEGLKTILEQQRGQRCAAALNAHIQARHPHLLGPKH